MKKLKIAAKSIKTWIISAVIMMFTTMSAYAADIGSSKLATGTEKLIKDATTWLMIVAPAVTVLLIIYYLIRKGMSEEMDHKKWNSRIMVALISCIGAVLAAVIVNLLVGYYQ